MTNVRVEIIGIEKTLADLGAVGAKSEKAVLDHIIALTLGTQAAAVRGIQGPPKTGRIYSKFRPKRVHQASAPGQYPATDTGRLVAAIGVELPTNTKAPVARVGTAVRYGLYLETKNAARGGRPWLHRALIEAAAIIDEEDLKRRMG